jgi:predicted RND superfamily exporter protein
VNFIALPITLGVGADYAGNVYARLRLEGGHRLATVIAETGSAVTLCSLTTIIGYGSLLLASNRALRSFGLLAGIGEVTCLLAALVVLPVMVRARTGDPRVSPTKKVAAADPLAIPGEGPRARPASSVPPV